MEQPLNPDEMTTDQVSSAQMSPQPTDDLLCGTLLLRCLEQTPTPMPQDTSESSPPQSMGEFSDEDRAMFSPQITEGVELPPELLKILQERLEQNRKGPDWPPVF